MKGKSKGLFKIPKSQAREAAKGFYPSVASWIKLRNSEAIDNDDQYNEWEGEDGSNNSNDDELQVSNKQRGYRAGHVSEVRRARYRGGRHLAKNDNDDNSSNKRRGSRRVGRSGIVRGSRYKRYPRIAESVVNHNNTDDWGSVINEDIALNSSEWDEGLIEEDKAILEEEKEHNVSVNNNQQHEVDFRTDQIAENEWDLMLKEEVHQSIDKRNEDNEWDLAFHEQMLDNKHNANDLLSKDEMPQMEEKKKIKPKGGRKNNKVQSAAKEEVSKEELDKMMNELKEKMSQAMILEVNKAKEEKQKMEKEMLEKQLKGIDDLLSNYICPISYQLMEEPVIAEDGQTYERAQIELWLSKNNKSPLTGSVIGKKLTLNVKVRTTIQDLNEQRRKIESRINELI